MYYVIYMKATAKSNINMNKPTYVKGKRKWTSKNKCISLYQLRAWCNSVDAFDTRVYYDTNAKNDCTVNYSIELVAQPLTCEEAFRWNMVLMIH